MPISHKYKTIFFHVPKAAGTSICQWLEIKEDKDNYYVDNYVKGEACALQHLTFNQLKNRLDPHIFNEYHKLVIIRNPWDRLVSTYKWRVYNRLHREFTFPDFVTFVYSLYKKYTLEDLSNYPEFTKFYCAHFYPQYLYLSTDPDDMKNTSIVRFENINTDIIPVKTKLNITTNLPHTNIMSKSKYRDHYSIGTKFMVEEMYDKDIKLFGYTF